ncbi:intradiol ring-cleavage dioxygenase [Microbacterium paraoxydans]|uniref:intradiol ring-cleavage dioxygenase n=1 Tax=Microbacterium paraoxydans TaxID=199592 RepID=UPI00228567EA|nr:intradiol ring-cleavage dioxygenase [Microbacterium paraoxydans]MCZ0711196.1 intradiol ring-cleavage dioxygenase [Microbacterium paraoxydans]
MSRIPEPTSTPQGPMYEGRPLDRADEEVVDQGVAFDLRTLMSRRGLLIGGGLGLGAVVLAACAPAATGSSSTTATPTPSAGATASDSAITEIPDETAGPYPGDGSNGPDVLDEAGIIRQDIRSSIDGGATADGVPLSFELQILDLANGGVPFAGVAVYAWHCNAQGEYSLYSSGLEDVSYLRGVQVADEDGRVSFTSVFPGCYSGRWPHIHFEVYPDAASITEASNAIATSQLALPEDACGAVYAETAYAGSADNLARITLTSDNVFGDDGGASQLATTTGSVAGGYTATLVIGVDTTTAPSAGSAPGGSGSGRPPGS